MQAGMRILQQGGNAAGEAYTRRVPSAEMHPIFNKLRARLSRRIDMSPALLQMHAWRWRPP